MKTRKLLLTLSLFIAATFASAQQVFDVNLWNGRAPHPTGVTTDTAKVRERFESWGLKVKFGSHTADREQPYFAGTDAQRAADLQAMIDDPGVKAVVSFQGGYGSMASTTSKVSSTSTACASSQNGSSGSAT